MKALKIKANSAKRTNADYGIRLLSPATGVIESRENSERKDAAMRRLLLLAAVLTLSVCSTTAAQQSTLTERDDRDDPCRRFKMRILEPADGVDYKMRGPALTAEPTLDPKMVLNPCPRAEAPLALAPNTPTPYGARRSLAIRRFRYVPQFGLGGREQSSDILQPKLPSVIEMMRGRRR